MFTGGIKGGGGKMMRKVFGRLSDVNLELRVGIVDTATNVDGENVAQVAFFNEYGTKDIPPRPFMRQTFDAHSEKWKKIIANRAKATPEDIKAGFELAGDEAVKDMNAVIEAGNFTENKKSTVAAKARRKQNPNTPLIDTGTMQEAIKFEVVEK